MLTQAFSTSTRVPDQISDLAVNLATVDVSQHTPLVFGDFSDIAMVSNPSEPHTLETLTAQVKINYDKAQLETGKLKEAMGSMRQDMAELHHLNQDLMTAMTELKQSTAALSTAKGGWAHGLRRGCRGLARSCGSSRGHQEVWRPVAHRH